MFLVRAMASEANEINRLEHLTRPAMGDLAQVWQSIARPALKRGKALHAIVCFAGLVVFAADDHDVLIGGERLQTDIVIRIEGVPIERIWQGAGRNLCRDRVSAVGRLLGMDR